MSQFKEEIESYGLDVNDLDCSPFESVRMLHDRSHLHMVYSKLNFQDKLLLAKYDLQLIQNANKMVEHIRKAYDFSLSSQSYDEWWWHLDKIAEGILPFGVTSYIHGEVI